MNLSENLDKSRFALPEDIAARFPEISRQELDEPVEIKDKIRAAGMGAFASFSGALAKFEKENPDAKKYVAFHLSFGSGLSVNDLERENGFDYPDGRIMQFLRVQLEELTLQP